MKKPIVFDIDGTLTSEHYNEDNLLSLKENSAMMLVALSLQLERPLVISTARPERFRAATESWLRSHGLSPNAVYMRPNEEEGIPDEIVKKKHLDSIRETFGPPMVWVDDNPDNVQMLREENVPVIHVHKDH